MNSPEPGKRSLIETAAIVGALFVTGVVTACEFGKHVIDRVLPEVVRQQVVARIEENLEYIRKWLEEIFPYI